MVFNNASNSSNVYFQSTSGVQEWADRMLHLQRGTTRNLAFSLSAGVLTIHGYDGTALSATNPGWVTVISAVNPCRNIVVEFTANTTITASDITGNLFGTTAGVAWGSSCPFWLYVVLDTSDTNPIFVISRNPNTSQGNTTAGSWGYPGTANADTQGSMWTPSTITPANYTGGSATPIGAFVMTKDSGEAWTIGTLTVAHGIGSFLMGQAFSFPTGQFGATSGSYLLPNGGTVPVFTTQTYNYIMTESMGAICTVYLDGDGGTDGAGAVNAQLSIPFNPAFTHDEVGFKGFWPGIAAGQALCADFVMGNMYMTLRNISADANLTYSLFTNGIRRLSSNFTFQALTSP